MSPTSINSGYLSLGERLDAALKHPAINGLYLPVPILDETFRDEFGFVFLDDGSIGPFYLSMDGILQNLWQRYAEPSRVNKPASEFLQGFVQQDITERALAVGTYNAMSAACMRQAGGESWGAAGRKYQLVPSGYPGTDSLLSDLTTRH